MDEGMSKVQEWKNRSAGRGGGGRIENLVKSEWDVLFLNVEKSRELSG